jgi:hypothetical protein
MSTRKFVFLITVLLLLYSCIRDRAGTAQLGEDIHYVDSSGNDLFSLTNDGQNGYWTDSTRAYDITNGNKILLTSCADNGIFFVPVNVLKTVICANHDIVNRYTYTQVHLKNGVDDTIKVHITANSITPSTNADSVWYNGVLKTYDSTGNIPIVK